MLPLLMIINRVNVVAMLIQAYTYKSEYCVVARKTGEFNVLFGECTINFLFENFLWPGNVRSLYCSFPKEVHGNKLENIVECVSMCYLGVIEAHLMEDYSRVDRNILLEILATIDEQMQILEKQIWDSGVAPSDTFQIRVPGEEDGEELVVRVSKSQVTPKPIFLR